MQWNRSLAIVVVSVVAGISTVQGASYYFSKENPTGAFDDTKIWQDATAVPGPGDSIVSYGATATLRRDQSIGGGTIYYYGGTTTWNLDGHTLTANASGQEGYMGTSIAIINGPGTFSANFVSVTGGIDSAKSLAITGKATVQCGALGVGSGGGAALVSIGHGSLLACKGASIGTGVGPTTIKLEIGPQHATQIDVYASGGSITFGTTGRLDLDLELVPGFIPAQNQTFDLMTAKGKIENLYFAQVTLGGLALASADKKAWRIAVVDGSRPNEKILRATYLLAGPPPSD